jgi:putative colanic acid biosynthesis UDP-glucose lipid carrier transferase
MNSDRMHVTSVSDIPLLSYFKRMLDPLVILGTLFLLTGLHREPFSGNYLVLAIIAFFVAAFLHEQIDSHRSWRSGRLLAFARDIFFGWAIFVAIIVLMGYATGFAYHYSARVIGGGSPPRRSPCSRPTWPCASTPPSCTAAASCARW